jgi:hypothetical protein
MSRWEKETQKKEENKINGEEATTSSCLVERESSFL